jgi:hypothetical protein
MAGLLPSAQIWALLGLIRVEWALLSVVSGALGRTRSPPLGNGVAEVLDPVTAW